MEDKALATSNLEVDGPFFRDGKAVLAAVAKGAGGMGVATLFVGQADARVCCGGTPLQAATAYSTVWRRICAFALLERDIFFHFDGNNTSLSSTEDLTVSMPHSHSRS